MISIKSTIEFILASSKVIEAFSRKGIQKLLMIGKVFFGMLLKVVSINIYLPNAEMNIEIFDEIDEDFHFLKNFHS